MQANLSAAESYQPNAVLDEHPEVLTQIFEPQINMACYQRELATGVISYGHELIEHNRQFNIRCVINAESILKNLNSVMPDLTHKQAFVEDLGLLVDMYACLFDLEEVGLRLQVLDRAMCPRFHTDKLGCRLVTTYQGQGSEWLFDEVIDRSKLGAGNGGLSDDLSGLYQHSSDIQQASIGDVLLLKGDGWFGNDGAGIVHRSPAVPSGEQRIVATMDFA